MIIGAIIGFTGMLWFIGVRSLRGLQAIMIPGPGEVVYESNGGSD